MEARHKDFKWFGEGFDGFPKRLPEDCVEYFIYVINSKLSDSEIRSQLRQIQASASSLTKKLLKGYIWQRQSFKLEIVHEDGLSFLHGQTNYGDSIEDEWLIVYMMLELSKQHAKAWMRMTDTDGEFLLIEAANVLPSWLNPEIAAFRPWLNEGKLLIIPDQVSRETPETSQCPPCVMKLQEALQFIEGKESMLLHSSMIEAEAFFRAHKFPGQIAENHHHSMIKIPRKLVYILNHKADYISPAVEAFYLRDPISLRPLQMSDKSKLIFPPEDLVTVSVKFTKVGFAQIRSQQFSFPSPWQSHWSIENDSKSNERVEIGMKLTCGFEMMVSDPHNIDNSSVREISLLLDDLVTGQDSLPSNAEISSWGNREDNDSWLDIDFEQLENELRGKASKDQGRTAYGFGDRTAQQNLRKIVARFEDFLNDEGAGLDGAEFDTMDGEDGESSEGTTSDEIDSDEEDKGISFDENQFNQMMREMMGMPANTAGNPKPQSSSGDDSDESHASRSIAKGAEDDDEINIQEVMNAMEMELVGAGVIQKTSATNLHKPMLQNQSQSSERQDSNIPQLTPVHEDDIDEIDIDYNLAQNLLESFKSQHGAAGPGGNLLGLMGLRLPRDEDNRK